MLDGDLIASDRELTERVGSGLVRLHRLCQAGVFIGHGDLRVGNHRAGRIVNRAIEGGAANFRLPEGSRRGER